MAKKPAKDHAIQPELGGTFHRRPGLVESDLGQDLLIFETEAEAVHALNLTAKIIWNSMSSRVSSVREIAEGVLLWYGEKTDAKQVARDVESFIGILKKKKLLIRGRKLLGREYNFSPNKTAPNYESPRINSFTRTWLKQHHPGAFYNVMFSDTWGPSEPTPGP